MKPCKSQLFDNVSNVNKELFQPTTEKAKFVAFEPDDFHEIVKKFSSSEDKIFKQMTGEFSRDLWSHNSTFTGTLSLKFTNLFISSPFNLFISYLAVMLNGTRSARSFSTLSHVHKPLR